MYFLINFIALTLFSFAENAAKVAIPLLITEYLNFSGNYSGYFLSIFAFSAIAGKIITGALADKFGRHEVYTLPLLLTTFIVYIYGICLRQYDYTLLTEFKQIKCRFDTLSLCRLIFS